MFLDKITKEQLDDIWKKELSFPGFDFKKKNVTRKKKKPIFAISSEEWRIEEEKRKKEEDELNKQKELKRFERELKKKIKLEEADKKKKEVAKRKELAMKKKLEKAEKEREQKEQVALLLKRRAESLGLEDYNFKTKPSEKKPKIVLNDVTSFFTNDNKI